MALFVNYNKHLTKIPNLCQFFSKLEEDLTLLKSLMKAVPSRYQIQRQYKKIKLHANIPDEHK